MKTSIVDKVNKIWLTNKEAQIYLGMSADYLRYLRLDGQLHFYKLRGVIFYKKSDIDKLIETHKVV